MQVYGADTIDYEYTIDEQGLIDTNQVTDRNGNVTEYTYDDFGNVIQKHQF